MMLEVLEHRRRVRHRRANLGGPRAHGPGLADPVARSRVLVHRPKPAPAHSSNQLLQGQGAGLPAESALRVAPEDVLGPDPSGRRRGRALLQPPQDVAGADEDDDRLQAWVARQHPFEDEVERFRAHAGAGDASDVHRGGAQPCAMARPLEHAVKVAGPARVLVQQVALGLTAACHEDPIERATRAPARHVIAPLAVAVDVEPHGRLEVRRDLRVRMHADAQARGEHVIGASVTQPPASSQLGHHGNEQQGGGGDNPRTHHGPTF